MKPYRNFVEWIRQQDKVKDWDNMSPTQMMKLAFEAGANLESSKFRTALEKIHDCDFRMDHTDMWAIAHEALGGAPTHFS